MRADANSLGIAFDEMPEPVRDNLIRLLFTEGDRSPARPRPKCWA
jgi:hypothetical protein